jgi:hypothetical protein
LRANSTVQGPITKRAHEKERNTQTTKQGNLHLNNDDYNKTVIITIIKVIIYQVVVIMMMMMMMVMIIIIIITTTTKADNNLEARKQNICIYKVKVKVVIIIKLIY